MLMKTSYLLAAVAITWAAGSVALGSEQPKAKDDKGAKAVVSDKAKKERSEATRKDGKELLTGSYLKRDIRRSGMITDGPSQVLVIDRGMIERSGASDLRQLLTRQGVH
jgi:hypothetical protein